MGWREDQRRYHTSRWGKLRRKVFDRDSYRCQMCGRASRLECDHKQPVKSGGDFWDESNLQALCRGCHIEKTARENRKPNPDRDAWREFVNKLL